MSSNHILSPSTSCQAEYKPEKFISKKIRKPRVNWHKAVSCAIQIELKDFSDYLKYETEYVLGKTITVSTSSS